MSVATGLEHKSIALKQKDIGTGNGFRLYGAVFGNLDRANEVIAPGAFKNLNAFVRDGFLALNHDWSSLPIGTISGATQDSHGLLCTGEWHGTPEAQAARTTTTERLARGKTVKCSIGYSVTDDSTERDSLGRPFRLLKAIDLFEVSIVAMPANELAQVLEAKGTCVSCRESRRGASLARIRKCVADFRRHEEECLVRALGPDPSRIDVTFGMSIVESRMKDFPAGSVPTSLRREHLLLKTSLIRMG
jgi:HK97 family phage prohead protease